MSRDLAKEKKLEVLEVVKANKDVLFGSYPNNAVSKVEREEAWKKVLRKAIDLGLTTENRNWKYARDHIFGLWKSRTLAKRDLVQRPIPEKIVTLNDIDEAILDIIESTSPLLKSLEITKNESALPTLPRIDKVISIRPQVDIRSEVVHSTSYTPEDIRSHVDTEKPQTASTVTMEKPKRINSNNSHSMKDLKRMLFESELHKNKLKILKLERELGLTSSYFTNDL